jgi:2-amino-4-hydroxy-6-hydroxymethyldihydropteridine diphosphokinase
MFNCSPSPLHDVYLGLGANLGDRAAMIRRARGRLAPAVEVVRCSRLYETPAWGVTDQPPFLNAVCHGRTALTPLDLLAYLKDLERDLGRVATTRWGPRVIDLDMLFFDDLILNTPDLTIPHPLVHERAFVLIPLQELAPDYRHPVLGASIAALASAMPDSDMRICAQDW